MKLLAAYLLAVALIFRAAPLCAAPAPVEAAASMPDCEHPSGAHKEGQEQKGHDAARMCHACLFPPAAEAVVAQSILWGTNIPFFLPLSQLTGGALKPPVPPPRMAVNRSFQPNNGVTS